MATNPALGAYQTILSVASIASSLSNATSPPGGGLASSNIDLANQTTGSPKVHRTVGVTMTNDFTLSTTNVTTLFVEFSPDGGTTFYADHEYDQTLDASADDFEWEALFVFAHESYARVRARAVTADAGAVVVKARLSGPYRPAV